MNKTDSRQARHLKAATRITHKSSEGGMSLYAVLPCNLGWRRTAELKPLADIIQRLSAISHEKLDPAQSESIRYCASVSISRVLRRSLSNAGKPFIGSR